MKESLEEEIREGMGLGLRGGEEACFVSRRCWKPRACTRTPRGTQSVRLRGSPADTSLDRGRERAAMTGGGPAAPACSSCSQPDAQAPEASPSFTGNWHHLPLPLEPRRHHGGPLLGIQLGPHTPRDQRGALTTWEEERGPPSFLLPSRWAPARPWAPELELSV